jgi:hypothetical protein
MLVGVDELSQAADELSLENFGTSAAESVLVLVMIVVLVWVCLLLVQQRHKKDRHLGSVSALILLR